MCSNFSAKCLNVIQHILTEDNIPKSNINLQKEYTLNEK